MLLHEEELLMHTGSGDLVMTEQKGAQLISIRARQGLTSGLWAYHPYKRLVFLHINGENLVDIPANSMEGHHHISILHEDCMTY